MLNIYKKFYHAFSISLFAEIILNFKGLILIPIITKAVGTLNYGIWSQVLVTVSMLSPLVGVGLAEAANRFLPGQSKDEIRKQYYSVVAIIFAVSVFVYLLILIFSTKLAGLFFGGEKNYVFIRFGALMLVSSVIKDLLKRYFKIFIQIKIFSGLNIFEGFAVVFLTSYLIYLKLGVWAPIISMITIDIIVILISGLLIIRQLGLSPPNFYMLRKYLLFGLPLVPLGWFLWISNLSDRYFLGFYYGTSMVGTYSMAYALALAGISFIFTPIFRIFNSFVTERWNMGDKEAVRSITRHCIRYSIFLSVPLTVLLSVFGKTLINILATPDFASGTHILPFICVGYIFLQLSSFYEIMIGLVNKTKVFPIIFGISALINLTLNFLLIPKFGMLGAAISTCCSFFIHMVLHVIISRRYFSFDFDLVFTFKVLIATIITVFAFHLFYPNSILEMSFFVFFGFLFYAAILLVLGGISRKEIAFATTLFKKYKAAT